jgi:hypothetical protein
VLAYFAFPAPHRVKLHSTNTLERLNKEVKRRANVVGIFPNEASILHLIGAVLSETTRAGSRLEVEGERLRARRVRVLSFLFVASVVRSLEGRLWSRTRNGSCSIGTCPKPPWRRPAPNPIHLYYRHRAQPCRRPQQKFTPP